MQERMTNRNLPLPTFKMDKNFEILERSMEAEEMFRLERSFLSLVDVESQEKVREWLRPEHEQVSLEVNMLTSEGELILVDVYVGWESELHAEVLVIKKDEAFSRVLGQLTKLRARLQDTNIELMHEKERLELLAEENRRLSAPFIPLSEEVGLVSMFGMLDREKIQSIEVKLLQEIYEDSADTIIFDFTASGEVTNDGVRALKSMFKSLAIMGCELLIAGVNQEVAKSFKQYEVQKWNISFIHSLERALKSMDVTS
ncbi:STAS domain-containing protein [Geomicrobium sp. JSM 1781026]|uniref:STAS domain-containing protein n=1 Tax=Geomicrobium sp. JSM 1781026 TaxID=3344580 RepID=UPI0035C1037B